MDRSIVLVVEAATGAPTQLPPSFALLITQRGHKTVSDLHGLVVTGGEQFSPGRLLLASARWLGTSC